MFSSIDFKVTQLLKIVWIVILAGVLVSLLYFFQYKRWNDIVNTINTELSRQITSSQDLNYNNFFKNVLWNIRINNQDLDWNIIIYDFKDDANTLIENMQPIQNNTLLYELTNDETWWYRFVVFTSAPVTVKDHPEVGTVGIEEGWIFLWNDYNNKIHYKDAKKLPKELQWKLISWFGFWPFTNEEAKEVSSKFYGSKIIPIGDTNIVIVYYTKEKSRPWIRTVEFSTNPSIQQPQQTNTQTGQTEPNEISATIPSTLQIGGKTYNLVNAWKKIFKPRKDLILHLQELTEDIEHWIKNATIELEVVAQDQITGKIVDKGVTCEYFYSYIPWANKCWFTDYLLPESIVWEQTGITYHFFDACKNEPLEPWVKKTCDVRVVNWDGTHKAQPNWVDITMDKFWEKTYTLKNDIVKTVTVPNTIVHNGVTWNVEAHRGEEITNKWYGKYRSDSNKAFVQWDYLISKPIQDGVEYGKLAYIVEPDGAIRQDVTPTTKIQCNDWYFLRDGVCVDASCPDPIYLDGNGITVKAHQCAGVNKMYKWRWENWFVAQDVPTVQNKIFSENFPANRIITSKITTFYNMFSRIRDFNQDISNWDTSNVTDFSRAFYEARSFNQNISMWNTDKATSWWRIFYRANSLAEGNKPPKFR